VVGICSEGPRRYSPALYLALLLALIHRSAWKNKISAKFGVARSQARLRPSGVGVGLSRDSNPISQALAEFVAWNRGKLSQAVAFQLPENLRAKRQNAHRIGEDAE
jgi:hypothetical protein